MEEILLSTIDGGMSWEFIETARAPGLLPASVGAVDSTSCWVLFNQISQARPCNLKLARIENDKISDIVSVGATAGWYMVGGRLSFVGPDIGWLVTGEFVNGIESGVVFSMRDGGREWIVTSRVPGLPTQSCFWDQNSGCLLTRRDVNKPSEDCRIEDVENDQSIGGHRFSISSTTDGGRTWQATTAAPHGLCRVVHYGRFLFVCGANGLLMRSEDQGLTWQKIRSSTRADIYALAFNKDGSGLAVGDDDTILFSASAGTDWRRLNHDLSGMSFHEVHFSGERKGIIVDPEGIYQFELK